MFLAPTPIHFHEGISYRQDVHFERPERTHPLRQSRYLVYFLFLLWAFFRGTLLSCWSKFFKKRQHSSKGIASASSSSNDTRAVARSLPDFLGERTREEGTEETLGNSRSRTTTTTKSKKRTKFRFRFRSEHHGRSVNSGKRGDGLISERSRAESSSGSSRRRGDVGD